MTELTLCEDLKNVYLAACKSKVNYVLCKLDNNNIRF